MNKICLDTLCNFALTTYKNYAFNNKNYDFNNFLNNIKQNQSLNENGIFLKHNFIELKMLIQDIENDQIVLINPLCFNLKYNIQWFNFLNALLTLLNDNYLHESNIIKKTILETTDKIFQKKIVINNEFNDKIINEVCISTNIILIILTTQQEIKYFNDKNNSNISKIIVMVNIDKEYFGVLNWKQKYYNKNSEFIDYLMNKKNLKKITIPETNDDNEQPFINVINKKKKIITTDNNIINQIKPIKSTKLNNNMFDFNTEIDTDNEIDNDNNIDNKINTVNNIDNLDKKNITIKKENTMKKENNGTYEELQADVNYALYISEIVDNTDKILNKNILTTKKKKKNDKNIFVVNKNDIKKSKDKSKDKINKIKCSNVEEEKTIDKESINKESINKESINKESLIFNETEKITKKDINEISSNIKISMGLEIIQAQALKLGITIVEGSTKTGKPKNKTKSELIEQIKQFAKNFSN